MKIEKKVWPEFFDAILSGNKKYELRLADWECNVKDTLVLKKWDPKTEIYTGREVTKTVAYVRNFKLDELFWSKEDIEKYGLQVISLE